MGWTPKTETYQFNSTTILMIMNHDHVTVSPTTVANIHTAGPAHGWQWSTPLIESGIQSNDKYDTLLWVSKLNGPPIIVFLTFFFFLFFFHCSQVPSYFHYKKPCSFAFTLYGLLYEVNFAGTHMWPHWSWDLRNGKIHVGPLHNEF